jgi:hypothetical protein
MLMGLSLIGISCEIVAAAAAAAAEIAEPAQLVVEGQLMRLLAQVHGRLQRGGGL